MFHALDIQNDRPITTKSRDYLGPATVLEARPSSVVVDLPDGRTVDAALALAFLYEPAAGDVLLVIGKGDCYYGIGVLYGTGRSVLAMPGDVELRAVNGTLTLAADEGVMIQSPAVQIQTSKLKLIADSVVETFESLIQRVRSLLSVHAGETHTVVDDSSITQAKSATILTDDTMTINGKQIHLG